MTDNDGTKGEQYTGYTLETETGVYHVCARDNGIEVTQGGRLVFTSEGAGSNVQSHTLEAHHNPELRTIIGGMNDREKELLVCMMIRYPARFVVKDEMIANKLAHKELAERVRTGKADSGKAPHKLYFRATALGKTIAQRLV